MSGAMDEAVSAAQDPVAPSSSTGADMNEGSSSSSLIKEGYGTEESNTQAESPSKEGKRRFWGLGKKINEEKSKPQGHVPPPIGVGSEIPPRASLRPASPMNPPDRLGAASPKRSLQSYGNASSPGIYAASPRPHSPASSQIFERSVQEDVVPSEASPHLPSHIITENHIPPVLEEASAAITDTKLDPDSVEIVTATLHQPASVTVTGTSAGEQSMASSVLEESGLHRPPELDESTSNIGSFNDPGDVRRLSFISFADVVHAEHAAETVEHSSVRDSIHHLAGLQANQRSPSPMRSPASSHGLGSSPPSSVSPSFKALDSSPSQGERAASSGSPPTQQSCPPLSGEELNVESMSQALRDSVTGDLSGARSAPMSAI